MAEPKLKSKSLDLPGFPDSSVDKEAACNAGDPGCNSWFRKICWRRDRLPTPVFLGFPFGSAGKESACNAGDLGSIPGLGRSPGEVKGYPLQYSGLYSPWDFKELDMNEQLSLSPRSTDHSILLPYTFFSLDILHFPSFPNWFPLFLLSSWFLTCKILNMGDSPVAQQ